jgi:hypothetical protein
MGTWDERSGPKRLDLPLKQSQCIFRQMFKRLSVPRRTQCGRAHLISITRCVTVTKMVGRKYI